MYYTVRFLPKNRFRIITPNHSLHSPQPPTSPSSNSFLSQLLAVTIPSISPRKTPIVEKPDESWEVPGQEGEVSLVASSVANLDPSEEDQQEAEQPETWRGTPEQHSSPLALRTSIDLSASQDFELPSTDWQVPGDMSNLLAQRLSPPPDIDSFSMSEMAQPPPYLSTAPSQLGRTSAADDSMPSAASINSLNDSNPTIRRKMSPFRPDKVEFKPETPTPAIRPFASIFADMSAEQADLSWPLTRPTAADETFHSAILANLGDSLSSNPQAAVTPKTTSDITQFFDCTNTFLSPPVPSLSSSSTSLVSRTSPIPLELPQPSKALFEAHSAHVSALVSELALYRALAEKLHLEVSERDGVLAELNVRVLEGEVWRIKVKELEAAVEAAQTNSGRASLSPSPVPIAQQRRRQSAEDGVDRTTLIQAETRDLEIRLEKALVDQEALSTQLNEAQAEKSDLAFTLAETRKHLARAQERERDAQVRDEGLRAQTTEAAGALHAELDFARQLELQLRMQLDEAAIYTTELEVQIDELKEVKRADEEEITLLVKSLENLDVERKKEQEWWSRVEELTRQLELERTYRVNAEQRVEKEKEVVVRLETNNREVSLPLPVGVIAELSSAR